MSAVSSLLPSPTAFSAKKWETGLTLGVKKAEVWAADRISLVAMPVLEDLAFISTPKCTAMDPKRRAVVIDSLFPRIIKTFRDFNSLFLQQRAYKNSYTLADGAAFKGVQEALLNCEVRLFVREDIPSPSLLDVKQSLTDILESFIKHLSHFEERTESQMKEIEDVLKEWIESPSDDLALSRKIRSAKASLQSLQDSWQSVLAQIEECKDFSADTKMEINETLVTIDCIIERIQKKIVTVDYEIPVADFYITSRKEKASTANILAGLASLDASSEAGLRQFFSLYLICKNLMIRLQKAQQHLSKKATDLPAVICLIEENSKLVEDLKSAFETRLPSFYPFIDAQADRLQFLTRQQLSWLSVVGGKMPVEETSVRKEMDQLEALLAHVKESTKGWGNEGLEDLLLRVRYANLMKKELFNRLLNLKHHLESSKEALSLPSILEIKKKFGNLVRYAEDHLLRAPTQAAREVFSFLRDAGRAAETYTKSVLFSICKDKIVTLIDVHKFSTTDVKDASWLSAVRKTLETMGDFPPRNVLAVMDESQRTELLSLSHQFRWYLELMVQDHHYQSLVGTKDIEDPVKIVAVLKVQQEALRKYQADETRLLTPTASIELLMTEHKEKIATLKKDLTSALRKEIATHVAALLSLEIPAPNQGKINALVAIRQGIDKLQSLVFSSVDSIADSSDKPVLLAELSHLINIKEISLSSLRCANLEVSSTFVAELRDEHNKIRTFRSLVDPTESQFKAAVMGHLKTFEAQLDESLKNYLKGVVIELGVSPSLTMSSEVAAPFLAALAFLYKEIADAASTAGKTSQRTKLLVIHSKIVKLAHRMHPFLSDPTYRCHFPEEIAKRIRHLQAEFHSVALKDIKAEFEAFEASILSDLSKPEALSLGLASFEKRLRDFGMEKIRPFSFGDFEEYMSTMPISSGFEALSSRIHTTLAFPMSPAPRASPEAFEAGMAPSNATPATVVDGESISPQSREHNLSVYASPGMAASVAADLRRFPAINELSDEDDDEVLFSDAVEN